MVKTAAGFDDEDDGDEVSDCPECGAEVYLIGDRCPKCGYWFTKDDRASMRRSRGVQSEMRFVKIAAALLGVILVLGLLVAAIMRVANN
jgi:predicted Zn-ribbon and HTH transcriptional regulator